MGQDYTGEVKVGGPMDVRRLPGLTIAKLAVGPMNNNAYLLRCTQTEEGLLIDGDTLTVGDAELEVIHVRGHTPGSIAVLYRDPGGSPHLFTGDSLFPGGVGKTWAPGDFTSLIDDVETRIFAELPDDTWFYPGHGDDSTLGAERPHLPQWRERGW